LSGQRIAVVGAGIVGLAVAREAGRRWPEATVTVVEREPAVAAHQTGHNSGVVHSGLYYQPGSLKARLCVKGAAMLRTFCAEHEIAVRECGKVVVATEAAEIGPLEELLDRGRANDVADLRMLGAEELHELEPHAAGLRAIHSPHTSIVDYEAVSRALASEVSAHGGEVILDTAVVAVRSTRGGGATLLLNGPRHEALQCDLLVTCAGLSADRVAQLTGDPEEPRIIPFRGEYFRLRPQARHLVNRLIYPVPDPRYPFLGVHLTPTVAGEVMVGPNAVLAFARVGYKRSTFSARDMRSTLGWPGFRVLARQHWRTGAMEMYRSLNKRRFLAAATRYVPELTVDDLEPAHSGVRAQAVARDGSLVDDFWLSRRGSILNVRNAPSPAATSSLAIAEHICAELAKQ
jgi:(S)-2-hydroxyglutarate dehydrogenase